MEDEDVVGLWIEKYVFHLCPSHILCAPNGN